MGVRSAADIGFATHLVNGGLSYSFNERWPTNAVAQYSTISLVLTLFTQLDTIYRPNDDIRYL